MTKPSDTATVEEMLQELEDYAQWDGTEVGEAVHHLVQLWESQLVCFSEPFQTALDAEVRGTYDWIKDAFDSVVEEEEVVQKREVKNYKEKTN